MNSFWTEEKVEELKELFHLGLDRVEIAKRMNVTKGMIQGKTYRLGLIKKNMEVQVGEPSPPRDIMKVTRPLRFD